MATLDRTLLPFALSLSKGERPPTGPQLIAFWTYILQCADGSYYTGHTDELERRIGQHQAGEIPGCYTLDKRPVKLAWSQDFASREEALAAEQQIKGWSRDKKRALIRGDWADVSRLARSKSARTSTSSVRTDLDSKDRQ